MKGADFRVVVLISGRGSNCRSLIQQARNYSIVAVISNNVGAAGLEHARRQGIEAIAIDRNEAISLSDQKRRIYDRVDALAPDLVALAGYMQILEPEFVQRFAGRIVNIHPSLLPRFKGLNTHERALRAFREGGAGVTDEHGCTVHFVDNGIDTGPVIAQARCRIVATDSEQTLAERVLTLEHRLFPWVVNAIATGDIGCRDGHVEIDRRAASDAIEQGFLLPAV